MPHPFLWTLIRVVIASLILGAVLAHFGITAEKIAEAALSKLNGA